jgi:hypothetical protein
MYLTIALVASFLLIFAPALGALVVGLAVVAGRTPQPPPRRD